MTGSTRILFGLGALLMTVFFGLLTGIGGGIPALAMVIGIVGLVLILVEFRLGVVAMVLMMPLTATVLMPRQLLGIPGFTPLNAVLALTFASMILTSTFGRRKLVPVPWRLFAPLLLLLASGVYLGSGKIRLIAAHFFLENPYLYKSAFSYGMDEFIKPCVYLVAVWMVAVAIGSSKRCEPWLRLVNISVLALPLLIIAAVLLSGYSLRELASPAARTFLSSTGLHANVLSVVLLPAFAGGLFMLPAYQTMLGRLFGSLVVGASVVALMLTFSRAAFLGVLLVTCVFFFLRGNFRYVIIGVIVCATVAVVLPDSFVERATTGFGKSGVGSRQHDTLTAGRVGGIWLPLLPEIAKHPIVGDGINATQWSIPAREGLIVEGHPHNAYLRLLMDHGIVGLGVVGYFLLQVWRLFRRRANDTTQPPLIRAYFNGVSVALVIFMIQCVSGSRLIFDYIQVFYWFAIAIGLAIEHRQRQEAQAFPDLAANNSVVLRSA